MILFEKHFYLKRKRVILCVIFQAELKQKTKFYARGRKKTKEKNLARLTKWRFNFITLPYLLKNFAISKFHCS